MASASLLWWTVPAWPQEPAGQPVIRRGINFVRVDVIVTDRTTGKPVTDLTATDFEVVDAGERQTIETFRLIDLGAPVGVDRFDAAPIRSLEHQTREILREDVRVIAILLDDYHVARGRDLIVREKLAQFVLQLNPRDLVAIVYPMTAVTDLVFTRDHQAAAEALRRFRGRKYDYTPANDYEARYALRPVPEVEDIRTQVSLSALRALSAHLGTLGEGRKNVLFVSEGMTTDDPHAPREPSVPRRTFGASDLIAEMTSVFNAANRGNTSIYTIDPRGLAPSGPGIDSTVSPERHRQYLRETADSLRILAGETGGRAIVNQNDFLSGLRQMLQDSSSYYLIGYASTRMPTDGRFHEIKVRVKRPGVDVRARKGYWALTDESARRAEMTGRLTPGPPPEVNQALSVLAAPAGGRAARTWIGCAPHAAGQTEVTIVWEAVDDSRPASEQAVSVDVTARTDGGDVVFTGTAARDATGGGGLSFPAAPGPLAVRIVIHGPDLEALDIETRTVLVPDFNGAGIAIGTPRIYRARTARDIAGLRADGGARPAASREFSRAERLLVRFDAWGPGIAPVVKARMLNMRGEPVTDLPAAAPTAGSGYELEIPLAPYAPNDYLIELASGEGGDAVRVLTALRIL